MKAHHHRQKVQNGTVVRRAATRAEAVRESARAPRRGASEGQRSERRREAAPEHGSRVLWIMMVLGGLLTIGFLLGVRSQITAHQISKAEERLRTELDRAATQQKFLAIDQERALSPGESIRAGKEAGLLQMKFNETGGQSHALPAGPAVRPVAPRPESFESEEDDEPASRRLAEKPAAVGAAPASPKGRVNPLVYAYPGRSPVARNVVRISQKTVNPSAGKAPARPAAGAARGAAPQKASKPAGAKGAKKEPANQRQVARVAPRR